MIKVIKGKWNKKIYRVIEKIGQGGIGAVYKVVDEDKNIKALKITKNINSITREHKFLNELKSYYTPKVYDMDDFQIRNKVYYFIVMDLFSGKNIKEYIKENKFDEGHIWKIGWEIGSFLEHIHGKKYIYGDLKGENVIITDDNKVKIIDMGGVSKKGESIREFTLLYDRSKFNKGIRKAEESYDLFSLTLLIINMILKKDFKKGVGKADLLIRKCKNVGMGKAQLKLLGDGLDGNISLKDFLKVVKSLENNYKIARMKKIKFKIDRVVNYMLISSIVFFLSVLILNLKRVLD
ncbi:MAG: protein kinase [Anaeromicrobium sp.]|jgi:serine/threonine-protein kinase|uniref:protein kinase domain-containing protein n=1 Tax=Anaeromicrobium sp. TaxID=1929132 RepID=UPI0025E5D3C6|nr:protein kinase [Anaeromicrobium sp.]MCT4594058.1 protein kinase [Anaeromicrobium sp.]